MTYIPPSAGASSFTCPHCSAISMQDWKVRGIDLDVYVDTRKNRLSSGTCVHCRKSSIWVDSEMVYPTSGTALPANSQMPESVKKLYYEAAEIVGRSPRAAAALLRLSIQVLCTELGEKGKNINDDIVSLVKKGLPEIVQQSLDVVRVTGNDAVHPGQIDTDDPETTNSMFDLVNIIVEYMIAMPNRVSGLYGKLPASSLDAIQKRDS